MKLNDGFLILEQIRKHHETAVIRADGYIPSSYINLDPSRLSMSTLRDLVHAATISSSWATRSMTQNELFSQRRW